MNDKELILVADGFRKGVLEGRKSNNWCYAISAPLAIYLEFCGYPCELVCGYIGDTEHYWIALSDGRILDPTADQFNDSMPRVYIGIKPLNYIEEDDRGVPIKSAKAIKEIEDL